MSRITNDGPKAPPPPPKTEAAASPAPRKNQASAPATQAPEKKLFSTDEFSVKSSNSQRNAVALGSTEAVAKTNAATAVAGSSATASTSAINAANAAVKSADADLEKLNKQLGTELAGLGSALDEQQKAAYTEAFKQKHGYADIEARKAQAIQTLAAEVQKPGVKELLANPNTSTSANNAITDALKTLAKTPEAAVAVKVVGELKDAPVVGVANHGTVRKPWGEVNSKEVKALLDTAAPNVFSAQLAAANGDVNAAVSAFKSTYGAFAGSADVQKSFELIDKIAASSDPQGALDALENNLSSTSEGFGAVGFLLAAYKVGSGANNVNGGVQAADLARLTSLFERGRVPDGVAIKVLGAVGNALKIPGATSVAQRLLPAVGALFSAKSALDRLAQDDKNLGTWIGFTGDVLGVVGGGISATVVGAPLGAILSGAGALIGFAGDRISDWINHNDLVNARKENLESLANQGLFDRSLIPLYADRAEKLGEFANAGVSPQDIAYLAKNYPGNIADALDPFALQIATGNFARSEDNGTGFGGLGTVRLGLSVEQVVELAKKGYGDLFRNTTNLGVIQDIKRKFKLDSNELIRLIDAGVNQPGALGNSPSERLTEFLRLNSIGVDAEFQAAVDSADPQKWVALLRSRGFEDAARVLETLDRTPQPT